MKLAGGDQLQLHADGVGDFAAGLRSLAGRARHTEVNTDDDRGLSTSVWPAFSSEESSLDWFLRSRKRLAGGCFPQA